MTGRLNSRTTRSLAALAAGAALCLNLAAAVAVGRPASAQAQNRAGLVVAFANGAVETRCVTFSESSISGYELMRRSGLPFTAQVSGLGAAMCKIGTDGCSYPAQSCFCKCENPASGCGYWIYGQWTGSAWRYAGVGAVARTIVDGQVDGWVWDVTSGEAASVRLPPVRLDQICAPRPQATPPPTQAAETATPPARTAAVPAPATRVLTQRPPATASPDPTAAGVAAIAPATATLVPAPTQTATAPMTPPPSASGGAEPTAVRKAAEPSVTETPTGPFASPTAASGEGIAGFLGIMAVLGGVALGWRRIGSRGGAR